MCEGLIVDQKDSQLRLTLNRPETRNALNAPLVESLISAVDDAISKEISLLVFSGSGKCFSAGFDLSDIDQVPESELICRLIRIEILLQKIYHAPMATLALAHGAAFGAGADLVVACSRRVASPETRFRMPGLGFGVVLGTRRLANTVGRDSAREILEGLDTIDASYALSANLLTSIVEREEWPNVEIDVARAASVLSTTAKAAMLRETTQDTRDRDLAILVRSATAPGLKGRIKEFVQSRKPS